MDNTLCYKTLKEEFIKKQREERQSWKKKTVEAEPVRKKSELEERKAQFWGYLTQAYAGAAS